MAPARIAGDTALLACLDNGEMLIVDL